LLLVADSMASVRPWKAPSKVMTRYFSGLPLAAQYLRAIFTAPSLASAPELQKKALSAKECATSFAASSSCSGDLYRLETCQSLAACSCRAFTSRGWL